jgi:DNA repair exonuclease SbcCD ATPase subunit
MAFDTYNAVLFKVLADNRNIQDSNPIVFTAGLASGTPIMKTLLPFQLIQKTEEAEQKEKEWQKQVTVNTELVKSNQQLEDDNAYYRRENDRLQAASDERDELRSILKDIRAISDSGDDAGKKIDDIRKKLEAAPVPIVGKVQSWG